MHILRHRLRATGDWPHPYDFSTVESRDTASLRHPSSLAGPSRRRVHYFAPANPHQGSALSKTQAGFLDHASVNTIVKRNAPKFNPVAFLAKVGEGRSIGTYSVDQAVFLQGDTADAVFYLQEGKVKLAVVSEQGKEAVVAILTPHVFFGEGCLAGQTKRMATATAMAPSVIVRLEKAAILEVIHKEPAFSELFIAHLLERSIRVEADLVDQLFNSSEKRLARVLLLLANFGKDGTPEPVIAKISQETLAQMIGTTRARVSFFMNKFRKLGFIEYNGGIEVHSSLLNVVLHDQPQIRE